MEEPFTGSFPMSVKIDLERTDLVLSEYELQMICGASSNSWKDFCLVAVSMGITCLINAAQLYHSQEKFDPTLPLFLNSLFGCVGVILALVFGSAWLKSRKNLDKLIAPIKERPTCRVEVSRSETGTTPQVIFRQESGSD